MDLKRLLFEATSSDHPLQYRTRCHVGKKCYTIAYVVNRKFLTLTAVLRVPSKLLQTPCNKAARLKRRAGRSLRPLQCSRPAVEYVSATTQTTDLPPPPDQRDDETQTPTVVRAWAKHTQTDAVPSSGRQQQTDPPSLCPQAVQTVNNAISLCTQTERYTVSRSLATDCIASTAMACQTEVSASSAGTQTDGGEPAACCPQLMADEREAEIVLLNEIGEMLINHNMALHNNTVLLGQLTEHTMLESRVRRHRMMRKQKGLAENTPSPTMYPRVKGHRALPYLRPTKESRKPPEVGHKAVQVDRWRVVQDNWSQTERGGGGGGGDELKRRSSWKFFKN